MFQLFPRSKIIRSEIASMADMDLDDRPSLFVEGSLSTIAGWNMNAPTEWIRWGYAHQVGFATNWSKPLSACPPRKEEFRGNFYSDRFVNVNPGKKQKALAHIEVKEAPVYDLQYRCPIDFTGFEVKVTLHEEAFGPFLEYVGLPAPNAEVQDGDYFRSVALRIPSAAFPFPEPRGGSVPYEPFGKCVTDLKVIREFEVNDLMVAKFDTRDRQPNPAPDASFRERFGLQPGLRLFVSS